MIVVNRIFILISSKLLFFFGREFAFPVVGGSFRFGAIHVAGVCRLCGLLFTADTEFYQIGKLLIYKKRYCRVDEHLARRHGNVEYEQRFKNGIRSRIDGLIHSQNGVLRHKVVVHGVGYIIIQRYADKTATNYARNHTYNRAAERALILVYQTRGYYIENSYQEVGKFAHAARCGSTPEEGPSENEARTAGSSEKSTAKKVGNMGRWNSRSCSTAASAANTAVHAIKRALNLIFFNFSSFPVRTLTVGTGISPVRRPGALADFTAGREFHSTSKIYLIMKRLHKKVKYIIIDL